MLRKAILINFAAVFVVTSTPLATPAPQAPGDINDSASSFTPRPLSPRTAAVITPTTSTNTVTDLQQPTGYFLTTEHVVLPGFTNAAVTEPGKTINIVIPTCIQTVTPDKNGYVPPGECGALYNYYPSFIAALITSLAFGMLMVAHITQAIKFKTKFAWVIIMGTVWETCAFAARTVSTKYQQSAGIELVSTIFILLAPLWINAFAYMVLARMIYYFHPANKVFNVPASVLSMIFVSLDIVSFFIQLTGGSYASRTDPPEKQMKGIHIYMGGIGLQQFFIVIFLCIAAHFHLQLRALQIHHKIIKDGWEKLFWTLYASLTCISIRIIYRLVEFSAGTDSNNPLPFHEYYLYILEVGPMFIAILLFNISHPGSVLKGPDADMPGLLSIVKRRIRRNKNKGADDGLSLVEHQKYESLDSTATVTDGSVEMHGRAPHK